MNLYIECFRSGKLKKRYSVTQVPKSGTDFLQRALKIDGYETKKVQSESELQTGVL